MKNIKKIIALTIIGASLTTLMPKPSYAVWKADVNGWWYTEGNSWATGWRKIAGVWYYFYSDGYMAHDTVIDGYYLNSYGEYKPDENITTSNGNAIQSGTYKIGTDLPAGEYLVLPGNDYGYYECTSDTSGSLDSIIYNNILFENEPSYITVNTGEYLKVDSATLYKLSEAPSIKPSTNVYNAGQYKVGRDIPAGTYRVTDLGYGTVEVNVDSRHDANNAILFESLHGQDLDITVEDGQYIELTSAQIKA